MDNLHYRPEVGGLARILLDALAGPPQTKGYSLKDSGQVIAFLTKWSIGPLHYASGIYYDQTTGWLHYSTWRIGKWDWLA